MSNHQKRMIKALLMDFGDTIVVEEEGKRLSDMELTPVKGVDKFLQEFSSLPIVIISNTIHSGHEDIERLLDELGFLRFIRKVITSLDTGVAKPDPRIFKFALEYLDLKPEDVMMIGDRMDVDIEGANRAGIANIHLHWRSRHDNKMASSQLTPTYCVKTFEESAEIVRKLSKGSLLNAMPNS